MLYKIAKSISLFLLAISGANAASKPNLPELDVSPQCKNYFDTEPQRALAFFCLGSESSILDGLKEATVESRRRLDETEPQANTAFEHNIRNDVDKMLQSTDGFSMFVNKRCVSLRKSVPEQCQNEFNKIITDAASSSPSPHSSL